MGSGVSRVVTGSAVGTGASLNLRTVGFRPRKVEIINQDSDDKLVWTNTMADAAGHKSLKAGGSSFITSLGITPLSDGFTLGADTDINVSGETVHFVAYE